jgi:hypothetical protein
MVVMPSEVARAWAAGILDADGCITMTPSGGRFRKPYLVVDSTDLEILEELIAHFGGSIVRKKTRMEGHRQQWSWRMYGAKNILAFLEGVVPYMRCATKVARARILLDEYAAITPRNGWYTAEQTAAKHDMEDRFMAIGHGRGASLRALRRPAA